MLLLFGFLQHFYCLGQHWNYVGYLNSSKVIACQKVCYFGVAANISDVKGLTVIVAMVVQTQPVSQLFDFISH